MGRRENKKTLEIAANFRESLARIVRVTPDSAAPRVGALWWIDSAKIRSPRQRHFTLIRHGGSQPDTKVARLQVPSQKPSLCKLHLACSLKTFRPKASNRELKILSPELNISSNVYNVTLTLDMEGSSIAARILGKMIKDGEI